jgi:hypothetical protein
MMEISNGGPAFPIIAGQKAYSNGMTLRDYFAGQALAALIVAPGLATKHDSDWFAQAAYMLADAMLAAREGDAA